MLASEKLLQLIQANANPANANTRPTHPLFGKTSLTISCFVAMATLPYLLPGLERWQLLLPAKQISVLSTPTTTTQTAQPATATVAAQSASNSSSNSAARPGEIEDASGRALHHFFAALQQAETGAGIARIAHYGDSPITGDVITGTIRQRLQQRFGDAGHGFVLTARPWNWYNHLGVKHDASNGWDIAPMFISRGDHRFGFGGASFVTSAADVTATFSTTDEGGIGRSVSAFDIYYLAQPNGGEFNVMIDGAPHSRVSTKADEVRSAFQSINVAEGAHSLTIKTVGNGEVRMFGVVLERGARGIQYDSLGNNGAFVGLLANYLDEAHWTEQLRHRQPNLVILNYGTNESQYDNWPMDEYERDTREVVRRIRAALPDVSILFVSPMDRGMRSKGGAIVTRPMIPKLVAAQRKFAAETGCAFFDLFTAMGGEGTAARWRETRPVLMGGDLTHPTWQGSERVGALLHDALIKAYEQHRGAQTARLPESGKRTAAWQ